MKKSIDNYEKKFYTNSVNYCEGRIIRSVFE